MSETIHIKGAALQGPPSPPPQSSPPPLWLRSDSMAIAGWASGC